MQTSVKDDPETVWEVVASTLGGEVEATKGFNGYHHAKTIVRRGETLARVLYGGPNGWPHVIATGAQTDDVVPVVRAAWSDVHEVTRMDSAQDFEGVGGYDRVRAVLEDMAAVRGMYIEQRESTRNGVLSRTTYVGAPSSRVRVRLYEKGCKELQDGREASPDWYRLELQVRPTGAARERASQVDAAEAWGFSPWARDLARLVMGLEVDRVTMQLKRDPDYARALKALERQYGRTLGRALEVEGSWDAVGRLLGVFS